MSIKYGCGKFFSVPNLFSNLRNLRNLWICLPVLTDWRNLPAVSSLPGDPGKRASKSAPLHPKGVVLSPFSSPWPNIANLRPAFKQV